MICQVKNTDTNSIIYEEIMDSCRVCLKEVCDSKITKKDNCKVTGYKHRYGIFKYSNKSIFLCSKEEEDVNSKRIFKTKADSIYFVTDTMSNKLSEIEDNANKKARRLIHNLTAINGLSIQELFNFIPQDILTNDINNQFNIISKRLKKDTMKGAKVILRIAKNNLAMKTEFSVFKALYEEKTTRKFQRHVIRKVLLNVMHTFFSDFADKDVKVEINESESISYFDYDTFSVAIFLIAENAAKYIMPKTTISVYIEEKNNKTYITFDMLSVKMLDSEIKDLCEEGISGHYPNKYKLSGQGIGMYRIKRLLEINGAEIIIENNVTPSKKITLNEITYEHNLFRIRINHSREAKREQRYNKLEKE